MPEAADRHVIGGLLEQIPQRRRAFFEERLFGSSAQDRVQEPTAAWALPKDLQGLMHPTTGSPIGQIVDGAVEHLQGGSEMANVLAEVLQVVGVPWRAAGNASAEAVLLRIADYWDAPGASPGRHSAPKSRPQLSAVGGQRMPGYDAARLLSSAG
jgi:hypothetical protein